MHSRLRRSCEWGGEGGGDRKESCKMWAKAEAARGRSSARLLCLRLGDIGQVG